MSNIAYLNGDVCMYSHLPSTLSLLQNNYCLHWMNYHLTDCLQHPYFLHLQRGRVFACIQTCVIIDISRNAHFWTFTFTVNLFQTFIWITINFILHWKFHNSFLPLTILILLWYTRLIIFYILILVWHPIPLQSQPPPLPTIRNLWPWRIKS